MKKLIFLALTLSVSFFAKNALAICGDNLVDSRDKKVYQTVSVGNACWMKENLRFEAGVANLQKNGSDLFYTWHDAMANSESAGARGICPSGWHIPTEAEWVAALNVASGNKCTAIDDAWSTYHCPKTSASIRNLLNITKLTYGSKNYSGVYWDNNSTLLWSSSKVTGANVDYIKHVLIDNRTSGTLSDSVFTDVVRKSWDAGAGYMYNALRCVQDLAVSSGQTVTCYSDSDQDGHGSQTAPTRVFDGTACQAHYTKTAADCNDNNSSIKPGATELCNSIDDNCNGQTDEGCSSNSSNASSGKDTITTCYLDSDRDGVGIFKFKIQVTGVNCKAGYVKTDGDCNDDTNKISPKVKEICDNKIDDNCNGQIDEACSQLSCWLDSDNDKFGNLINKKVFNNVNVCPTRYINNSQDCNDNRSAIKPGATELCNNKIDDNCNGQVDEGCIKMTCYRDSDNDKFGNPAGRREFNSVSQCPAGYVVDNTDCNDFRSLIRPGISELCGNKIDDNCNKQVDDGCSR